MHAQDFTDISQLYARYACALSSGDWEAWPDFFLEDCLYKLVPRENHERGFPLATLMFESQGMLRDRVYGVRETLFHDPYYQRIIIGPPLLHSAGQGRFECEANYSVFRTKLSELPTVFSVGRYLDTIVATDQGLKFATKLVIYDNEMIANSIIYPI